MITNSASGLFGNMTFYKGGAICEFQVKKQTDGGGELVHFSFSLELIVTIEAGQPFILHDNVDFKIYLVSLLLLAWSLFWLLYNLVGVNF